jgi:hypothetical protein
MGSSRVICMDDEFTLCKKEGDTDSSRIYTNASGGGRTLQKPTFHPKNYVPIMTLRRGGFLGWCLGSDSTLNTVETTTCFFSFL